MGAQRAQPKKKSTTLQYLFDLDSTNNNNSKNGGNNMNTNNNRSTNQSYETEELLSIISYCTTFIFTFTDPSETSTQQDFKGLKLTQLLSLLKSSEKPTDDDQIISALVSMISANLFRPLPPSSNPSTTSDSTEDEDPITIPTPSWPHLQIVYSILLWLIINSDPKTLRCYIDHSFLLNMLLLFQSEDPRERESLKNTYHRIYSKFTFYRSFMRKSMINVFLHFVCEMETHCGIRELLEIWGSIINGFTVPLKEEHKMFLMRVLIPLHKPKGIQTYHRQLAYCVSQFVQKEPVLCGTVVRGILRYWPVTNCQKEVLLIGELEELVENIDPEQYKKLAKPLCTQIAKCLNSSNSQVAERAIYVWNNEQFVKMAMLEIAEVFPEVVKRIEMNLRWHWSRSIRQLTESIKAMLEEMDQSLYFKCVQDMEHTTAMAKQEEMKRKLKWEGLEMAAAKKQIFQ
ncbi:Protein phosphatase 2A [Macleaya cordata]|uniref:Protein phosphatase 2A n=1 Tax=Macleaya cordata TaxID=56857 RepID=A0A200QZT6_MACCD|nr:Protein phosphatase 2A [Macleaya cordata]